MATAPKRAFALSKKRKRKHETENVKEAIFLRHTTQDQKARKKEAEKTSNFLLLLLSLVDEIFSFFLFPTMGVSIQKKEG